MAEKQSTTGSDATEADSIMRQESDSQGMCGIIMPISEMPGYTVSHWLDVRRTIVNAAKDANFSSDMVSTGADVGIIHANIINNIYQNEMVVCDVSGKNANVMFELGLRLASKLPVIIIKDDATTYSFDTSPIEHLEYRKDLRIYDTLDFQKKLTRKIIDTYNASKKPDYKTFLDHFGNYTLAKVEDKTVELGDFIKEIYSRLNSIEQRQAPSSQIGTSEARYSLGEAKIISDVQQLIQSKVNSSVGSQRVDRWKHYLQLLSEVEEEIIEHYVQDLADIAPELTREAVGLAIRQHITTRAENRVNMSVY